MRFLAFVLVLLSGCYECKQYGTRLEDYCVRETSESQYAYSYTDGRYHYVQVNVCVETSKREVEVCERWERKQ